MALSFFVALIEEFSNTHGNDLTWEQHQLCFTSFQVSFFLFISASHFDLKKKEGLKPIWKNTIQMLKNSLETEGVDPEMVRASLRVLNEVLLWQYQETKTERMSLSFRALAQKHHTIYPTYAWFDYLIHSSNLLISRNKL